MAESLPDYTHGVLSGPTINQLGQFEKILEDAKGEGVINTPPDNETETYDYNSQRIRIQTIASRLWLLGYLPRKIRPEKIPEKLDDIKEAVGRFQKDADLKQDNWVGDKTWYALDELVSFESDTTYSQWFANGAIKPEAENAVHRAVQLRLWCLGLYPNKPDKKFRLLKDDALKSFGNILKIFLIRKGVFKSGLNYETLKILFDQDLLTNAIARRSSPGKKSFLLKITNGDREKQKNLAQAFIINCAKIELWLLGYEVEIDGINNYQYTAGSSLYKAMEHYYQHFENLTKARAGHLASQITPAFFEGISTANDIVVSYDSDDLSEEVAKEFSTARAVDEAWSYLKNKGMRLWDGLKRIWRWIKKIGKKVVTFIKENIFKAFFRYASKAFKIVQRGIAAVVKSINIYIKGELCESGIFYRFSKDMDTTVYLTGEINGKRGIDALQKQSKAFNLGCRIIGWIFNIFKNMAIGFVGWAKLLFSLLKGYKELKILYRDFKAVAVE